MGFSGVTWIHMIFMIFHCFSWFFIFFDVFSCFSLFFVIFHCSVWFCVVPCGSMWFCVVLNTDVMMFYVFTKILMYLGAFCIKYSDQIMKYLFFYVYSWFFIFHDEMMDCYFLHDGMMRGKYERKKQEKKIEKKN